MLLLKKLCYEGDFMDDFIEQILHIKAEMFDYTNTSNLPLYLKGNYELHTLKIAGTICLLAEPKEAINLRDFVSNGNSLKGCPVWSACFVLAV